ncbi:radical SAM protein [Gracilinema caldarium]|uniref:B12-binding domain-containing radical SAM protein n=1 Tax=Gracilinema caldarium TaxID=215591 RepID=UPI0026F1A363|nr:radical SAM protein [Gracilinema caldarium]
MADIVLATINAKWIHPSLALRLLQANLGELAVKSRILEFALRQPLEEKVSAILAEAPRILAFSVSIWNHEATLALLDALEFHWQVTSKTESASGTCSRPIIVLGGPEVSYLSESAPLIQKADWVVRGEGEEVFPVLCEHLLWGKNLKSLEPFGSTRGKWIYARPVSLEEIKSAYHLYTDEDIARKLIYVEASRGCPFGCEFCLSSLDRRVRTIPLEQFLLDMDYLFSRGARSFKFLDRTFNLDTERAEKILQFFIERIKPPAYVHFEMVPSRFPDSVRILLMQFPPETLRLEVGIQTFTPEVAKTIGRPSNPEKEQEALRFLREKTHAIVHADLIAGLPGETLESFARSFNLLWSARPTEIQLGILKKLPGAPISRHDEPFAMVYDTRPPYEVLETGTMARAELDALKNFARFWELVVNRGHFDDLVPLLLPESADAFGAFMDLSQHLLGRFGRNWGIDRQELRQALSEWCGGSEGQS